jgi:hypothetical protein
MQNWAMAILFVGNLLWPLQAQAGQPCEVVPVPCTFEALPFKLKVVDAETQQPLSDVHALAEWPTVGPGGRSGGPLMALDSVSGPDGELGFPGWGPIQGPVTGLEIGSDPVMTLFKTRYKALVINNADPPGTKETQRVRRFYQNGRTYAVQPFRGTPVEWLGELRRVWLGIAGPRGDLRVRDPYLNRLRRISTERDKSPLSQQPFEGSFFWHVDRELKFLEEGH